MCVPCRRESRIMRGGLYIYSKRHRLNACSTARDTYTRKKKNRKRQKSVCGPKKMDCDMYSNIHRLKASSPARDTFSRQINKDRSKQAAICMRHNKNGSCAADHTCIHIGIAWTAPQAPDTHTRKKKNGRSQTAGVCMRPKKIDCVRQIIHWLK